MARALTPSAHVFPARLANGSAWACGAAAADALRAKVAAAGGTAHCVVLNVDRYGRDVALCDVGGEDVASWLARSGWALAYKQYGGGAFAGDEAVARGAHAGVWASSDFTPPWEWRAQQRAAAAAARGGGQ
jgi:endonuclease YncB( thermonuclease family)